MIELKMRTSATTEEISQRLRTSPLMWGLSDKHNPMISWNKDKTRMRVTSRRAGNISRRTRFTLYRDSPESLDVRINIGTEVFAHEVELMENIAPELTDLVGPVVSTWLSDEHTF